MKIVFVSNYLNHHQLPLCEELMSRCDSFFFIATDKNNIQGFQNKIEKNFVIYFENNKKECLELINNADACIFGDCPSDLMEIRMKSNKLSFLYTERFFKKGTWRKIIPTTYLKIYKRIIRYRNKNMFVLCASAFVSRELKALGFPINKCFKWGYFPETNDKNNNTTNKLPELLFAGRMINWKHPEFPIFVADKLRNENISFHLRMIGTGNMENKLVELIKCKKLDKYISMCGPMKPKEVREYMKKSDIFILPSDQQEGWGVVLNEAMNSGCAVVCSDMVGAAPYLIQNGFNGLMFKDKNVNDLYCKVKRLCLDKEFTKELGLNAVKTIASSWNSQIAADRFLKICDKLIADNCDFAFENDICSRAYPIKRGLKK